MNKESATKRQTWALFCRTGYDFRPCNLSKTEASKLISASTIDLSRFPKAIKMTDKKQTNIINPEAIYQEAHTAGLKALKNCKPTPMVVQTHKNMFDDNSPVIRSEVVSQGVCGFAWVKIRPARGRFIDYCKKHNIGGTDDYSGGYTISASHGGQSMELNLAYATAFAEVLQKHGINAISNYRLD